MAAAFADQSAYRKTLRGDAYSAMWALRTAGRGTTGTGDDEWRTPEKYIKLARAVLGEIDLDPASSALAQEVASRARQYFDKDQNGLRHPWLRRIFLNPPYSRSLIGKFVTKLLNEVRAGRVDCGDLVDPQLLGHAVVSKSGGQGRRHLFTTGRVRFKDVDGELARPTQGQCFHYYGDNRASFINTFAPIGFVLVRP